MINVQNYGTDRNHQLQHDLCRIILLHIFQHAGRSSSSQCRFCPQRAFEAKSGNILTRDVTNLNVTLSGKYFTMVNGGFEFHGRKEIVIP